MSTGTALLAEAPMASKALLAESHTPLFLLPSRSTKPGTADLAAGPET